MFRRIRLFLSCSAALVACAPAETTPPEIEAPPLPVDSTFVDWTAKVGLPDVGVVCLAMRDFDGDGRPDIITDVPNTRPPAFRIHRNSGAFPFPQQDVAVDGFGAVLGCSPADVDGDGDVDLLVSGYLSSGVPALEIFTNANGTFSAGQRLTLDDAADRKLDVRTTLWGDFDGDGWQDLVVSWFTHASLATSDCASAPERFSCGLPPTIQRLPPRFFRNDHGHLEPMALTGAEPALTNGMGLVDWDGDGKLDLFLSNDYGENAFLRHTGDGFSEQLGPWKQRFRNHGMGVAFADFDHDGLWDLFNVNAGPGQLLLQRAGGSVEDATDASGVGNALAFDSTWSPLAGDFNDDGEPDLFVTGAILGSTRRQLELSFRGASPTGLPRQGDVILFKSRDLRFTPFLVPQRKSTNMPAPGSALSAMADLDGDGRLDIVSSYGRGENELRLLHDEADLTDRHWLEVEVRGTSPNPLSEGALVTLTTADGAHDLRQVANAGVGHSDRIVHFGLGNKAPAKVHVRWADGAEGEFEVPAADRKITVDHP